MALQDPCKAYMDLEVSGCGSDYGGVANILRPWSTCELDDCVGCKS